MALHTQSACNCACLHGFFTSTVARPLPLPRFGAATTPGPRLTAELGPIMPWWGSHMVVLVLHFI